MVQLNPLKWGSKTRATNRKKDKLKATIETGKKLGGRSGANKQIKAKQELKKLEPKEEKKKTPRKTGRGQGNKQIVGNQNRGGGKTSTSKSTTKTKTKKVGAIEKQNRANLGDKTVNRLKQKSTDFKSYQKGTMTKAQFIKKYPNSNLAKGR